MGQYIETFGGNTSQHNVILELNLLKSRVKALENSTAQLLEEIEMLHSELELLKNQSGGTSGTMTEIPADDIEDMING